ncbi:MAG: 16S rRNA (uracil(1498)-N(3))-methyltransferase [Gallionella sp.]
MPRFYCPPPLPDGQKFELPADAAHHAIRVLRLRETDSVEIFDGQGNAVQGVIDGLTGKRVVIGDLRRVSSDRESPLSITLAQSLTGSEKMDWIVQKATELGVSEIQPLDTERSVARLTAERTAKRLEHWQQVIVSACEQCGRNVLPRIHPPVDVMAWLDGMRANTGTKLILLPDATVTLKGLSAATQPLVLLIGPEGGFAKVEADSAIDCGFQAIRMGARVLRTETAAIAGLAALQTFWGDY